MEISLLNNNRKTSNLEMFRSAFILKCPNKFRKYILLIKSHMSKEKNSSKKYAKISEKRRNNLIELVSEKKISVPKAAKLLKLKVSTAKNIIKVYKREGRVMSKKMSKKQKQSVENKILPSQQVILQTSVRFKSAKKQNQSLQSNAQDQNLNLYYPQYFMTPMFYWNGLGDFNSCIVFS